MLEFLFSVDCNPGYEWKERLDIFDKYGTYIDSELLRLTQSVPICNAKFYRDLVWLYWILWLWGLLLILTTLNHLFIPMGLSLTQPYHIGYWL